MIRSRKVAVAKIDVGVPADWAERTAGLAHGKIGEAFGTERLARIIHDGNAALALWSREFVNHGWTAADLFAVHEIAPAARFDAMGAIVALNGSTIRSVSRETMSVAKRTGSVLTMRRRTNEGGILLWEISAYQRDGIAA
jgi:hypothetical protein